MLAALHIENYALIRLSDIQLDGGFVAITGETGAGKSILLGALSLLLGQRADTSVLLDSSRKCIVEATFNLNSQTLDAVGPLFADNDVDTSDDGTLIIRREILPSAKSRAFVNDTPVQLSFLKELGKYIVDIHSQHETLLLGDGTFRISLIDSLANTVASNDTPADTIRRNYQTSYQQYVALKRKLEHLLAEDAKNRKDFDYNQFLFDELQQAHLVAGEQQELEEESRILANAEGIQQALGQVVQLCDADDEGAMQRLNFCKSLIAKVAPCHKDIDSLYTRFESAFIELRDIVDGLDNLGESINYSPERQQQVDERLDLIYRLEKKHNVDSVEALLTIQDQLDQQLSQVSSAEQEIKETMEAVDKAFAQLQQSAEQLTSLRKAAASKLEERIAPLFADLGMPNAQLQAQVLQATEYGPMGNDKVSLLFNANRGGQLRELSKVASGGEMSRLMLAIKALTAEARLLPTVVFDEIDSGISGDISMKVGRIMQRMARTMQVIAITHLPQIAARASQHFKVYKTDEADGTSSRIRQLDGDERRHEVAVMLSADPPTEAALQTASELMFVNN